MVGEEGPTARRVTRTGRSVIALALGFALLGALPAAAAEETVGLGTAASFAVIGASTVTNTGPTTINGDVGLSPGTAVGGFPTGTITNGVIHAADAVALQAQADVTTAYNDAAGRATTGTITADLGGQVLVSGVYTGGAIELTGTLTLDAQGDPNAVFVFQAASTLMTGSTSRVNLINGADACNVFWQVGSSATLGTNSVFVGTVLALTSVAATTGTSVQGRLFARNGAVTLDTNVINRPICEGSPPDTTSLTTTPGTATTIPPGQTLPPAGSATSAPALAGLFIMLAGGAMLLLVARRAPS